jgi:hypothetical protein
MPKNDRARAGLNARGAQYACVRIPRKMYLRLKLECVRSREPLLKLMARRLSRPDDLTDLKDSPS